MNPCVPVVHLCWPELVVNRNRSSLGTPWWHVTLYPTVTSARQFENLVVKLDTSTSIRKPRCQVRLLSISNVCQTGLCRGHDFLPCRVVRCHRYKASYRSVSGLTGTGSSRWSGSPVPALAGEVVHRLDPTGSPVWTGYPVEMSSQGVIVDLVS